MEPIFKEKNTIPAVEVLFFEDAEVEKVKGNSRAFATMGPLSVLYFKNYNRFVLQINDWRYPLLRRLPIMGADKIEMKERLFHLPALNGFSFNLRIRNIHSSEALNNLEVIMKDNAGFYYKGEEVAFRKMDASPDDKLMRMQKKPMGMMDTVSEKVDMMGDKLKMGMDKMKMAGKQMKKEVPAMMGMDKKRRVNLKDIKRRSFRKSAHPTFKKDWFESHEKMTKDIHVMRKHNFANVKLRSADELRKADHLPILYIPKEDIEESILINKDLAAIGKFHMGDIPKMEEKKGLMDQIKQGLHEIKDSITGRVNKAEAPMDQHKISIENMSHYQG